MLVTIQRLKRILLVYGLTIVFLALSAAAQSTTDVCNNGAIAAFANPVQPQCLGQPENAPAGVHSDSATNPIVTGISAVPSRAITITVMPQFTDMEPPETPGTRQAALKFTTFDGGTIEWTFSGTCRGTATSWPVTQTISCPPVGGGPVTCLGGSVDPGSDPSPGGVSPGCSPIILDIGEEGFHLTSAPNGVSFDITGTGQLVQIAWTDPRFRNAFLALPGSDGMVHKGKELFGNFTPQPPSNHPNGFLALAEYDKPENGGDRDGVIDERDAVYSRLRLWIDENHNGISELNELHTLSELGISSISLMYHPSRMEDKYGNVFRYRARVNPVPPDDQAEVGKTPYDVFLTVRK